jgi:hypothetical protein
MIGLNTIDKYTMKARVFPAAIALSPALALVVVSVEWDSFSLSDALVALASIALLVVLADIARRNGKQIEKQLIESWGGLPSTHLLRYRNVTLDASSKRRYLKFLAGRIGEEVPTPEDELDNPSSCDEFYSRCCLWLRENTRNHECFGILFEENMNYGFRRNMLGLKHAAFIVTTIVVLICVASLVFGAPILPHESLAIQLFLIVGFSVIHSAYFVTCVTKRSVHDAALLYSRQLILCCEKLSAEKSA